MPDHEFSESPTGGPSGTQEAPQAEGVGPSGATGHLSPAQPIRFNGWVHIGRLCAAAQRNTGTPTHVYQRQGAAGMLCVLSSFEMAEYRGQVQPHNHVSVSVLAGRRPTDDELLIVRADFDMDDAEEDNHLPGRIRNLFLPLNLPRGTVGICDCKENEEQVVEADGFTWSRKVHA